MHRTNGWGCAGLAWVAALASGCAEEDRASPGAAAAHVAQGTESEAGAADAWSGRAMAPSGCSGSAPVPGTVLHDVWIAPDQTVWTVGSNGLVGVRTQAGRWCWCVPDGADEWRAVWGAAADDVWVVGTQGRALHLVDGAWRAHAIAPGIALTDVWGSGANDVYVVGGSGLIRHFDGRAFHDEDLALATYHLDGVWGADVDSVWAVGSIPVRTPLEVGSLPGVDLVIFRRTTDGWLRHGSWNQGYGGGGFVGIDGSSRREVWAVGPNQPAGAATGVNMAARFAGDTWQKVEIPHPLQQARGYSDVAVGFPGAPDGVFIATRSGRPVRGEDFASVPGGRWFEDADGPSEVRGVDANAGVMWAVGEDVSVSQYTAEAGWRRDFGPVARAALRVRAP